MKQTKIMLAVITTIILTWMLFGLVGYLLSDLSYRDCMTHGGTLLIMLLFGFIPAIIVGYDLDNVLE